MLIHIATIADFSAAPALMQIPENNTMRDACKIQIAYVHHTSNALTIFMGTHIYIF